MKKMMLAVLISVAAFAARADVITNTVVIVSNFYSQAFIETVVTQKVKSSHTDYWFTNHVNTITHDTLIVSQTNLSVNVDVGRDFVIAASNQANRAASAVNDSRTYANASAGSASSAASSASAASSSASSAAATRSAAASECASALATINARINWFDQHSGETITQNNYYWTTNLYFAEDSVARSMASSAANLATNNQAAISSLEGRVGNNIETLQGQLATANGRINSNASAISSLEGRVGNNISAVANLATNNQAAISSLSGRVDDLDELLNCDAVPIVTQVVYACASVPAWTFKVRTDRFTIANGKKKFEIIDQVNGDRGNQVSSYNWCPASWNYQTEIETTANGGGHGSSTYSLAEDFLESFTVTMHQLAADVPYTFNLQRRTYEPTDIGRKVPVRKMELFGDRYDPAKSDNENLSVAVDAATGDLQDRVGAVEDALVERGTGVSYYTANRSYVVWAVYYTYNGSKFKVRIKIYTDRPTLVSSDAASKTYQYDYEVLAVGTPQMSYSSVSMTSVQKRCVESALNDSEVIIKMYDSGNYTHTATGFSDDPSDFAGSHAVGSTTVMSSNRYWQYVFEQNFADSTRTLVWTLSADLNLYDADGVKIGRIMRETDWSALSNWVEQVFQKK